MIPQFQRNQGQQSSQNPPPMSFDRGNGLHDGDSDGSENEVVEGTEQDLNQDFEFIDDVLTNYMQDMQEKEAVLEHVKRAITKGKKKIPEELRDAAISEV